MKYFVGEGYNLPNKLIEAKNPQMALRIYLGLTPLDMGVNRQKIVKVSATEGRYYVETKDAKRRTVSYYNVVKV